MGRGEGSCISCFDQGLHRVMGRRVLLILFFRGLTAWWDRGGSELIILYSGVFQRGRRGFTLGLNKAKEPWT